MQRTDHKMARQMGVRPEDLNDRELLMLLQSGCAAWTAAFAKEQGGVRHPDTFDIHSAHMTINGCLLAIRDRLNVHGIARHPEFKQLATALATKTPGEVTLRGSAGSSMAIYASDKPLVDFIAATLASPRNPWQNYMPG